MSVSLYNEIDQNKIRVLNIHKIDTSKNWCKPVCMKNDQTKYIKSENGDPELLICVTFNGYVNISSIVVGCVAGNSQPLQIALIKNKYNADFNDNDYHEIINLYPDPESKIHYPLSIHNFESIHYLAIRVTKNCGSNFTQLHYIGIYGTVKKMDLPKPVHCVYCGKCGKMTYGTNVNSENPLKKLIRAI